MDNQWEVDLMDMSEYANMMIDTIFYFSFEYYAKNSGVSSILVVIDTCGLYLLKIRTSRASLQHFRIFSKRVAFVIKPDSVRIKIRNSYL